MLESYKGSADLARASVHEELTIALSFRQRLPSCTISFPRKSFRSESSDHGSHCVIFPYPEYLTGIHARRSQSDTCSDAFAERTQSAAH